MASERKVAIITGASQGIGASVMEGFRQLGYGVVANSRTIGKAGIARDDATLIVDGDVASPETADRIVSAAIERFGRIDTLVNNAGIFIPKPFLETSKADFAAMVGVNLAGFFHMSQKVIPWMLQVSAGHVVNITATIAEQPMRALPTAVATMTKAGLNGVTRALAIEYAGRGIRVNAVSPTVIDTPLNPARLHDFLVGLAPMGRLGAPQDVCDAVLYLENADFVTGEILHVDGGASAGRW
jgi:NAD(P)-dependent dehydrogenase (short-subunit alcohol dehydrogenase family)